jgi:hypothetical protein
VFCERQTLRDVGEREGCWGRGAWRQASGTSALGKQYILELFLENHNANWHINGSESTAVNTHFSSASVRTEVTTGSRTNTVLSKEKRKP